MSSYNFQLSQTSPEYVGKVKYFNQEYETLFDCNLLWNDELYDFDYEDFSFNQFIFRITNYTNGKSDVLVIDSKSLNIVEEYILQNTSDEKIVKDEIDVVMAKGRYPYFNIESIKKRIIKFLTN